MSRLNVEIVRALTLPELRTTLASLGLKPLPKTPEQYGTFVRAEIAKYATVIKEANIQAD